jgi:hypothetical protein
MKLSKNFSLSEFEHSDTAKKHNINNEVRSSEYISNATSLCTYILQPVRNYFNKSVDINSGYRSPELNKKVGGSSTSQHCFCQAADIEIKGISNKAIADYIAENLDYDQLILEFYKEEDGPNSGWVHVSFNRTGNNRNQKLVALKDGRKTVYKPVDEFDETNEYEDYA